LDGQITGPEKFASNMGTDGQTFIKGPLVWGLGTPTSRVYLEADVTEATGAAYTTIFTIPLTMTTGKEQVVIAHLIQSTDTATTAIQNRAQISGANAIGVCTFTSINTTVNQFTNIVLTTTSADTAQALTLPSTDPVIQKVECAIGASNTNATDLVLSFQAETAGGEVVTTHAGSWYEHIVH